MSSNPQRRPSRSAPRPPRPSFPPSSMQRCDQSTSSPRSSSPTLSTNSDSRRSLPDYQVYSSNSSPHEIRRHRRGSVGDNHPRRPAPSQRPRKRAQTVRSKSVRHNRPQITIVSAEPMSHHPAFADGAKGSYIPPEAPPSYDEAMKAPLPRNPSFTDPAFPDHISQQRRVFPTVESVSLPQPHSEEEIRPNSVTESARSNSAPRRELAAERLVVQLPTQDNSHCSSPGPSRERSGSSLNPAQSTDEEKQPVPTPRTRRKVSLHRNTPPSTSELTNTPQRTSPVKPPIPPKKPHLTSPTSPTTSHQHFISSTTSPVNHNQPDLLSSLDDSSHQDSLPVPMLPSSRKLPPPPRPQCAPRKPPPLVTEKNTNESVEAISQSTTALQPETSTPSATSLTSVDRGTETSEVVEKVEPVYAQVHKVPGQKPAKQSPADETASTNEDSSQNINALDEILTDRAKTPPLVPTTRPPIEDYEGILFNTETDHPSTRPTKEAKQSADQSSLTISDTPSSRVSPSSSIDSLYESVRFHKNPEEKSMTPKPRVKPPGSAPPLPPVQPPPLPASRPVGHIPNRSTPPPGGRRQSSGDIPKREKNESPKARKVVRRKSTNFKEKGLKLFRHKNNSEASEKSVSDASSHFYTESSPKPKKVPPPRPAPPSVLQRKITEPSLATQEKSQPPINSTATHKSPSTEKPPTSPAFSSEPTSVKTEAKPEHSPATKPSRPVRPPPNRPPPIKAPSVPAVISNPTNGEAPPLPKPRRQQPKPLITLETNITKDTTDGSKSNGVLSSQDAQKPLEFDLEQNDSKPCDVISSPPRSPSANGPLSPPGSAKLKPARPPPAMFSTPLLPLHVTQKKTEQVEKNLEEIQPQIDEQMKKYVDGEEFYIAVEDYEPTNFTDLSFAAGEKVSVMKRIDDVTLFGRNEEGEEGTFPEKYVRLESDLVMDNNKKTTVVEMNNNSNNNNNNSNNSNQLSGGHEIVDKVVAIFSYTSNNPEDLAFTAGDIIHLEERVSSDWMKGTIGSKTGIFPSNFVQPAPFETQTAVKSAVKRQYGVATFDFIGTNSDELSFKIGNKIELLEKLDNEWTKGKLGNKVGIFPLKYVQSELPPKPAILFPKPSVKNISQPKEQLVLPEKVENREEEHKVKTAIALFDFTGKDSSELNFKTNDVIKIIKQINEDWFEGELNEQTGIFPANFVQL